MEGFLTPITDEVIGVMSVVDLSRIVGTVQDPEYVLNGFISGNSPEYRGDFHITPDSIPVIVECQGTFMGANLVVDPIPSNYGLITWNGSTLLVS